jgi:4-hydroxybenzoate polyprenyltransferase
LLAVNCSIIALTAADPAQALAQALVSLLTLASMYAFNDFYDAPTDAYNPKKDRTLVATYLEHRSAGAASIITLKILTVTLAFSTLGFQVAAIVVAVLLVNFAYSTLFKGLPLLDVAWCSLWGALYVGIVDTNPEHIALIGLMTAICHLYQTIDDRDSDAASGIVTTAVRSVTLSTTVMFALSLLLFFTVRAHLGDIIGLTAFAPSVFLAMFDAHAGWLLSKVYFGVVWLYILGFLI